MTPDEAWEYHKETIPMRRCTMITPTQAEAARQAVRNIPSNNPGYVSAGNETLANLLSTKLIDKIVDVALTAAAEVKPMIPPNPITDREREMQAATIERCAQVAESYGKKVGNATVTVNFGVVYEIAAAIRALKDK